MHPLAYHDERGICFKGIKKELMLPPSSNCLIEIRMFASVVPSPMRRNQSSSKSGGTEQSQGMTYLTDQSFRVEHQNKKLHFGQQFN